MKLLATVVRYKNDEEYEIATHFSVDHSYGSVVHSKSKKEIKEAITALNEFIESLYDELGEDYEI